MCIHAMDITGQYEKQVKNSRLEAVADAPDGDDKLAEIAQLLAQSRDVGIHDSVNPVEVVAPELFEQKGAAEGAVGVADEEQQQIEFFWGQVERRIIQRGDAGGGVYA